MRDVPHLLKSAPAIEVNGAGIGSVRIGIEDGDGRRQSLEDPRGELLRQRLPVIDFDMRPVQPAAMQLLVVFASHCPHEILTLKCNDVNEFSIGQVLQQKPAESNSILARPAVHAMLLWVLTDPHQPPGQLRIIASLSQTEGDIWHGSFFLEFAALSLQQHYWMIRRSVWSIYDTGPAVTPLRRRPRLFGR